MIRKILNEQGGYTIIEMITIILIMVVLTGLVVGNTRVGDRRQVLRDAANQFVVAAKQAESMAAGSQPVRDPSTGVTSSRRAYGVCITADTATTPCTPGALANSIQIYARRLADCDPASSRANPCPLGTPTSVDVVSTIKLPTNIRFGGNGTGAATYMDFLPPVPTAKLNGADTDNRLNDFTARFASGDTYTRSIMIKPRSGAVYVQ